MIINIILIIVLTLVNAFFAMSEIAFISLNDAKMNKMAEEGNKKAKKISGLLEDPSKFLATIQIGITLGGFLASAFAADAFASKLTPLLSFIPISPDILQKISLVIITIILSYFTLVFGELVPKKIAMKYYEKISFAVVGILSGIYKFTKPFVWLLSASTNGITKLLGIKETEENTVTEEEIKLMIDIGEEKGAIEQQERVLIHNVFEFNDKTAEEIMVPRVDVLAIDVYTTISEAIEIVNKNSVVEYDLEYTNDGKILDKIENQEFDMEIDKDLDPKLFIGKKIGDIIVLDSDQLTSQAKIKGIYKKKLYDSDHYVKEDIEELGFDSFEEFEDVYIDAAEHEAYEDKIVDILTDELLKENDIEFSDELLSFYLKRNDYNVLKSKKQSMKDYFLKIMQIQGEENIGDEEELAVLFSEVETLVLNRTMTDEYEKTMTRRIENYKILNFLKDKCIIE